MSSFINTLVQADHPAQVTPATTESFALGEVAFDATVTEVEIIPSGALTASDTANRVFTLQNRSTTGAGTTTIATLTTNLAGGSWVAHDALMMTLSPTPGNLNVAAGDVLSVIETVTGAGVAHPAMQCTVRGTRR